MSEAKETYVNDDMNDLFGIQTWIYFEFISSTDRRGQELLDQLKKYGWKVAGVEDKFSGTMIVTLNQACEIDDIIEDFEIKTILDPARWRKNTGEIKMGDDKYHYILKYKGRWVNDDNKQKRTRPINTPSYMNNSFYGATAGTSGGFGSSMTWPIQPPSSSTQP
jgi:hypothetical protein